MKSCNGVSFPWLSQTPRSPDLFVITVNMPDATEKASVYNNGGSDDGNHVGIYVRPTGIKGIYSHPVTQVCMLGLVCFMCPGSFCQ